MTILGELTRRLSFSVTDSMLVYRSTEIIASFGRGVATISRSSIEAGNRVHWSQSDRRLCY